MQLRAEIQREFVRLFSSARHTEPKKVHAADLERMQADLHAYVPESYRQFILEYGTVYTPRILDFVDRVDGELFDVQDFIYPKFENWMKPQCGFPSDIFPFAGDCMGNIFGFKRTHEKSDDAPVWFWDHDFLETIQFAPSFDEFLLLYIRKLGPLLGEHNPQ